MNNKKTALAFIIISLLLTFPVFSKQKNSNRISLDKGWNYTLFENAKPHLPIHKKKFSELSTIVSDHKGYIWLSNSFIIPTELEDENLAIYLGQIKIAAEVYVNDTLIGVSGWMPPQEFFFGEKPAAFTIPKNILRYNHQLNTVTIKLWVNAQGKISDNPFIDVESKVMLYNKINNMFSSEIPFAISIFLFFISILYIFFYFIRPADKSNLSFGLLTFFSSFYLIPICFGEYPSTYMMDYLLFQKIFNAFVPFSAMFFAISFIRDYLGRKEMYYFKLFRIIVTSLILYIPFFPKEIWHFYILQVIGYIASGFLFLYPVKIILEDLVKGEKRVKSLLIGFSPILLSLVIAATLTFTTDFQFIKLIVIFGWQFTILIFLGMLLINYVKLFTRVEFVNSNLEKIVKSKTQQLQDANKELEETNTHLEFEKKRTEKELQLASFVQQNFYTLRKTDFTQWEIAYYFRPLNGVSGDLYDLYIQNDELKGLGIFDVSGHGISSGLVTMLVKNIIQQEFFDGEKSDVSEILYKINERVINEKGNIENYLTGIIGRLKDNQLEFVNAGHPEPVFIHEQNVEIIKKSNETQCGVIGIGGLPTFFATTKVEFTKGDTLVLFTDGYNEAQNPENSQYGKQNLLLSISKYKDLPVKEMSEKITEDVFAFIDNAEIKDDMTLLILRRK